jgi:phage gp46-like protein
MSDIGLTWDPVTGRADMVLEGDDLQSDDGLETAVMLSLFTDRRAADGDVTEDPDKRGWWGDARPVVDGDRWGSRLWLLGRAKETQEVLRQAKDFAAEALQWLTADKVATKIDVESGIIEKGVLGLGIKVYRPNGDVASFQYRYNWAAQEARRA